MTNEELRYEHSTMNCDKDTYDTKPIFISFAHIKPSDFCDDMVSLDVLDVIVGCITLVCNGLGFMVH